jgi:hypothetical protein
VISTDQTILYIFTFTPDELSWISGQILVRFSSETTQV